MFDHDGIAPGERRRHRRAPAVLPMTWIFAPLAILALRG
jgi:hypothetical protein